jgi:hypothetical protein
LVDSVKIVMPAKTQMALISKIRRWNQIFLPQSVIKAYWSMKIVMFYLMVGEKD